MSDFLELLTTDFIVYALAAGLSLALVAGPLGSFIVWRRMSYFGDTLAHSALLGIAIGLLTNSNPQLSIIVSCLFFAFILTVLDRSPKVSTDTLLGRYHWPAWRPGLCHRCRCCGLCRHGRKGLWRLTDRKTQ